MWFPTWGSGLQQGVKKILSHGLRLGREEEWVVGRSVVFDPRLLQSASQSVTALNLKLLTVVSSAGVWIVWMKQRSLLLNSRRHLTRKRLTPAYECVCVSGWMLTLRCKVLWVVGKTRKVLCNGPCSPFTFSKLWKMTCLRAKEVRNLCCIVFSPTQHKDEVAFAQEKQLICIPNEPREIQLSCPLCLSCCYFAHSMNLNPGPTALCSNKLPTEGDRDQQWALSWHSGVVHAGHSASFLLSLLDGVK